jgi:hypothetical protein
MPNYESLWIDAICINQRDLKERACQVAIMNRIYQMADSVLIWLGNVPGFDERARKVMDEMSEHWNQSIRAEKYPVHPLAQSRTKYRRYISNRYSSENWGSHLENPSLMNAESAWVHEKKHENAQWLKDPQEFQSLLDQDVCSAIETLLLHPWFTRSWVVQEATNAKLAVLVCGKHRVSWETLRGTCGFLREHNGPQRLTDASYNANSMVIIQDSLREIGGRPGSPTASAAQLRETLQATRHLQATDPRDKIFAFLSLDQSE